MGAICLGRAVDGYIITYGFISKASDATKFTFVGLQEIRDKKNTGRISSRWF